jgi:hypothetical protein
MSNDIDEDYLQSFIKDQHQPIYSDIQQTKDIQATQTGNSLE